MSQAAALRRMIQTLAAVLQSLRLYPATHPQVQRQLHQAHAAILPFLQQRVDLALGIAEDLLLIEDFPCDEKQPGGRDLYRVFHDCKLTNLRFLRGLTPDELLLLLLWLIAQRTDIGACIQQHQLDHIRVTAREGRSREVYLQAVKIVQSVFEEVRFGHPSSTSGIDETAQNLLQQAMAAPQNLLAMTQLRDYDNYTFTHSVNVAVIVLALGQYCGLTADELELLGIGGLLHDLGKMAIDRDLVNKPGVLTQAEWLEMQRHPHCGYELLAQQGLSERIMSMVRHHHVRYDRTGYPQLETNEEVDSLTSLVAVADSYDAMTTLRCYQTPMTPSQAAARLRSLAGSHLHPFYVERLLELLGPYPAGTLVRLIDGRIALVVDCNHPQGVALQLKLLVDQQGQLLEPPQKLNLSDLSTVAAEADPLLLGVDVRKYL